jgi:hypothetical protein
VPESLRDVSFEGLEAALEEDNAASRPAWTVSISANKGGGAAHRPKAMPDSGMHSTTASGARNQFGFTLCGHHSPRVETMAETMTKIVATNTSHV